MNMKNPLLTLRCLLLLAICGLGMGAVGCGEDEDEDDKDHSSHGDGDGDGDGSLYLIATSFTAGDETETYLVTTDSWDRDTEVDPTDGPKLLGGVVPIVHDESVYVPDSNSPVMQRYDLNDEDKLELGDELSFMAAGLTELASWHIYIVSDDRGYVFDPGGPRIIIWDPSAMELTGDEIDLSDISRDGWAPNLVFEHAGPQRVGDQLLIPLGWADQDWNSRHASGVLVIDVSDDSVVAVDEDERCGESYSSVVDPDGNIYFFPPDWSALSHFYADDHTPSCALRVKAGETEFDDDHLLDLSELASGGAAAGAVPDGDTGFLFVGVDEELYDDGNNESGAFWRMYHYDFATEEAREIDSLPVWVGHSYWVNVGGQAVLPFWIETDEGWETTMYGVDGSADPEPVFTFDASWYGAAQLR